MLALIFVAWFLLWIITSTPWPLDTRARQFLFAFVLIVLVILIAFGSGDGRYDLGGRLK